MGWITWSALFNWIILYVLRNLFNSWLKKETKVKITRYCRNAYWNVSRIVSQPFTKYLTKNIKFRRFLDGQTHTPGVKRCSPWKMSLTLQRRVKGRSWGGVPLNHRCFGLWGGLSTTAVLVYKGGGSLWTFLLKFLINSGWAGHSNLTQPLGFCSWLRTVSRCFPF